MTSDNYKIDYDSWRICHDFLQVRIQELALANLTWSGRNCYPFNRCFWILEGTGLLINHTTCQKFTMSPGHCYFMPAMLDLSFVFPPGLQFLSCHFNVSLLPGFDFFTGNTRCVELPWADAADRQLFHSFNQSPEWHRLCQMKVLIWNLLSKLPIQYGDDIAKFIKLQGEYYPLLSHISETLTAKSTLKDLAQFIGWQQDYLSRRFSRDFGIPLKRFLQQELLEKAEQYLLFSDQSVKEVAANLKFSSEFYFSSFFKRLTGISPSEFRRHQMNNHARRITEEK